MSDPNRFLGAPPGTVVIRLLFLSLLVGAFLAFLNITPFELLVDVIRWLRSAIHVSFGSIHEIARWVLYGAMIVIPVWLVSRLFDRR